MYGSSLTVVEVSSILAPATESMATGSEHVNRNPRGVRQRRQEKTS